jgi:ribosomal protein L19
MSLLRRVAQLMAARSELRRSAASALSCRAIETPADRSRSSSSFSSSSPATTTAPQQLPTATPSARYYHSPTYASAAAAAEAAAAASPSSSTLRPAPPPPGETPQHAPAPPWTPTRLLTKRKRPQKRMRALIQHLEREHVERAAAQKTAMLRVAAGEAATGAAGTTSNAASSSLPASFPASKRELPRAGDVLEVRVVVPEAGRKVYTYRGVCLGRSSKGPRSWLKMYNVFPDAGGVVQHLPM